MKSLFKNARRTAAAATMGLAAAFASVAGHAQDGSQAAVLQIKPNFDDIPTENGKMFEAMLNTVRAKYLDPERLVPLSDRIDEIRQQVIDGSLNFETGLKEIVSRLDHHSSFEKRDNSDTGPVVIGDFARVGMEVSASSEWYVTHVYNDGPATYAGIRDGDRITHINGENVSTVFLSVAADKICNRDKNASTMTIERASIEMPLDVKIHCTRRTHSVQHRVLGDDIGYIRIGSFEEKTGSDFQTAVRAIQHKTENKLSGYIIDLRGNPGGFVDPAIRMLDDLLDDEKIMFTERDGYMDVIEKHKATLDDITNGAPLIVLMNGGSASASEIVALVLQERGRAQIVGERSYGKGVAQSTYESGAIKLKITTFHLVSERNNSVQAKGVIPDVEVHESPKWPGPWETSYADHFPNPVSKGLTQAEKARTDICIPDAAKTGVPRADYTNAFNDNDGDLICGISVLRDRRSAVSAAPRLSR